MLGYFGVCLFCFWIIFVFSALVCSRLFLFIYFWFVSVIGLFW